MVRVEAPDWLAARIAISKSARATSDLLAARRTALMALASLATSCRAPRRRVRALMPARESTPNATLIDLAASRLVVVLFELGLRSKVFHLDMRCAHGSPS